MPQWLSCDAKCGWLVVMLVMERDPTFLNPFRLLSIFFNPPQFIASSLDSSKIFIHASSKNKNIYSMQILDSQLN
jgi:hypothetical protein